MNHYDLVIVGGGIAGLCAALEAPPAARIVVIDKGEAGAGSSPLAQGGMAAAVGPEDSVELHAKDTIDAGAGICDEQVVGDICAEGPAAVRWLLEQGCVFDRGASGELDLAREGGQTVARSVHWRDATGAEIVRALRAAVRGRNVERRKGRIDQVMLHGGICTGVVVDRQPVPANAVLMATGGAGGLWGATTNAEGATADGLAISPAALIDLEFMQFHPTALAVPGAQLPLLTEALRGHGARLVGPDGERFVDELAPRHVVAKAILDVGNAFLDCRDIARFAELFPTVAQLTKRYGFDPTADLLPVTPVAHYYIGGIASDANGRTSIPRLYAAGECASTGMHGANRLAGNSLLETVVVGRRVGAQIVRSDADPAWSGWATSKRHRLMGPDPRLSWIMWNLVGPIRDDAGLRRAISELGTLSREFRGMEHDPYVALCLRIAAAAKARVESRGVHIRSDVPAPDETFARRAPAPAPSDVGRIWEASADDLLARARFAQA